MAKYAIGIDFGTLSARALVAEIGTGRELSSASMDYPHAVMDRALPDGTPLKPDWALQHPQDYLDCLQTVIPEAIRKSGVSADDIIGVGVDFTCSTVLPIDANGDPLCLKPEFAANPYAWCMLWKHHAAQDKANRMTEIIHERGESFIDNYGGKVSSEWMLPKLWQVLDEAPEIYEAADRFIEAGDWIVLKLTGCEARASSMVGYKAFWSKSDGYPGEDFFRALDPRMEHIVDEKLAREVLPVGVKAGEIDEFGAALTGLNVGTAVAPAGLDSHVALPPAGVVDPGKMLMIIGTSSCHLMLGEKQCTIPGLCGIVEDGMIPGLFGYEAGQSCCGDHFKWFVDNCAPHSYFVEAQQRGMDMHRLLTEKAEKLRPGQSGLIALDWWNGNRSVLVDFDLTGMILGMTLTTRPEEIYRALIEATAYGTRVIIDAFEEHGVHIESLYACGGIAKKNAMFMQIYADVLQREIRVVRSTQAPAFGSAMYGAVAAGKARGGYDTIQAASAEMSAVDEKFYSPIPEHVPVYDALYREYLTLHDYFGRGENDVMKRLKKIREQQS